MEVLILVPILVISAVNLRSGGPLSVLKDSLHVLNDEFSNSYRIIAIVHKKEIFEEFHNIEFIEFPKSANSYLYRIYLEYFYFKKLSKQLKPHLWFSLHDITPNVCAENRAVYCHNPSPFYKASIREFLLEPNFLIFNFLYHFFYVKNINNNDFIVVQQNWLRDEFVRRFSVDNVIVAQPSLDSINFALQKDHPSQTIKKGEKVIFFYPAFPRVFKNIEVLCKAVKVLKHKGICNFELWLTIDGSENRYSRQIISKYSSCSNIKFKGLQTRESVFAMYRESTALLFPSKLETWGLPITEFKKTNKPMIVADLPYAHEAVGQYGNVTFFYANDADQLANIMQSLIDNKFNPQGNHAVQLKEPFVTGWRALFDFILQVK